MINDPQDMNPDPITKSEGSHPVGVGVGGVGGAVAGAGFGTLFGPIGMLIGGAVGTLAGAAAGKGVAESIDPTGEHEYWRSEHLNRPYASAQYNYDDDYAPAYQYGNTVRELNTGRTWDDSLEQEVRGGWEGAKAKSRLSWNEAKDAARDAFERSDRTYKAYDATDKFYRNTYKSADYYKPEFDYDNDYRPAYRYGTQARSVNPSREWNADLESELGSHWDSARATSRLSWNDAKHAAREAWHGVERAMPGDADGDGR